MLKSMTGFGSVQRETQSLSISVEIKTLNSKFTDIYCRLPRNFTSREIEIRNLLQQELERGKIDISLNIVPKEEAVGVKILNRALVKAYFKDLLETAQELDFDGDKSTLFRIATSMPNALNLGIQDTETIAADWQDILATIHECLQRCQEFRIREGQGTKQKFIEYIQQIEQLLTEITEADTRRIPGIREKITRSLGDLVNSENYDHNRYEQELIYYIEKFDISEEKVRLKEHLNYFISALEDSSNGKKLNFIAQEIGREINTIGSKANDATIQRLVVQMKDELEKIKEQTSNIL